MRVGRVLSWDLLFPSQDVLWLKGCVFKMGTVKSSTTLLDSQRGDNIFGGVVVRTWFYIVTSARRNTPTPYPPPPPTVPSTELGTDNLGKPNTGEVGKGRGKGEGHMDVGEQRRQCIQLGSRSKGGIRMIDLSPCDAILLPCSTAGSIPRYLLLGYIHLLRQAGRQVGT